MVDNPTSPLPKLPTIDERNIKLLAAALAEQNSKPNILTLDEFRKYAPLYTTKVNSLKFDNIDSNYAKLAMELQARLNLYKPLHIIKSHQDPEVVLRLPQLLTPLKSLSPTAENDKVVSLNYAHRQSDIPKVWSTAQNMMTSALLNEQSSPDQLAKFVETRTLTNQIMQEFKQQFGLLDNEAIANQTAAPDANLSSDDFEDV